MAQSSNEQPFPGSIPFRELSIGDIFSGLFRTIRQTWRVLFAVGAVVGLIAGLLSLVITFFSALFGLDDAEQALTDSTVGATSTADLADALAQLSDDISTLLLGFSLALISALIMQVLAAGVITHIAADAILGRRITGSEAWARIKPRIAGLIGLALAVFGLAIAGAAVAIVPILVLSPFSSQLASGLLISSLVAALVLAIVISIRLSLAAPIYILEQTTIGKAITRSNQLIKGSSWRLFGYLVLSSIIAQFIGGIFALPTQTAALAAANSDPTSSLATFFESVSTVISTAVALPITAIVLTLLYTDLRIRKENFADELRRASGN
jgi:hypothetical protein